MKKWWLLAVVALFATSALAQTHGDAVFIPPGNFGQGGSGGGTPAPTPTTQSLFGAINVMNQAGASASLAQITVTTNGTTTLTATGIGSSDFAAPQYVGIYGAGPAPSALATPTGINISAMSTTSSPSGATNNTTFQTGCVVINTTGSMTAGSSTMYADSDALYEVGNSIVVTGAGAGAGNLSTTVTAINRGSGGNSNYQLAAAASTSVTSAAITGGNCTTTRNYRVRALGNKGGMGPTTATQTLTTTANALNWENFVSFQVNTQSAAVAYLLEGCEGAACTNFTPIDVEVPTYSDAYRIYTFPYLDFLLPVGPEGGQQKAAPTVITLHDWGLPYGNDFIYGQTLPATAVNEILFATLSSVGTNSAVFTTAQSTIQSGTFTMVHDIGPAINSAIAQACTAVTPTPSGGPINVCVPIILPATPPKGGYSLVTGIAASYVNNFRIDSYTNIIDADVAQANCTIGGSCYNMLNWRGPLGGTAVSIQNANNLSLNNFGLNALTTMGVGLDIDETPNFTGETTTAPNLNRVSIGQSSVGIRLSNINTSNVEFGTFYHVNTNLAFTSYSPISVGGIGMLINSGNSLRHQCTECQLWGQIGLYANGSIQFDGGQVGANNGIGTWAPAFLEDDIAFHDMRQEGVARAFYSPLVGSTIGMNGVEYDTVQFTAIKHLPDGIFFAFPGAGSQTLRHNRFYSSGGQGASDTWGGANNFYTIWSQGVPSTTLISEGNKYPGNTPTAVNPFAALNTSIITTEGDLYANINNDGFITQLPGLAVAQPTSGTIISSCNPPFTVTNIQGTEYRASCNIAGLGGELLFPLNVSSSNNWSCAKLNVNGNPWATFRVNFNGGTNTVSLVTASDVGGDHFRFSDILTNPYTFNGGVSGNSFELLNQTLQALTFTIDMGNWANCQ
jgi:hypothetical protein